MGLTNMPNAYPCMTAGTAVLGNDAVDGAGIDCDATIKAGGCPWADMFAETPGNVADGAPCVYRGKVGMQLLAVLEEDPPFNGFYGPDMEGLDAEQCNGLAAYMEDRAEAFSHKLAVRLRETEDLEAAQRQELHARNVQKYRYASRWLRWVAEVAGGCGAHW